MLVDVLVVAVLLLALIAGIARGFFASLGTLVGLVVGGLAAYWLVPLVAGLVPSPTWRGVVTVALSVLLVGVGVGAGSALGGLVRRGVDRTPLRWLERLLGGAASLVVAALVVSVVGAGISTAGIPTVSPAVASSSVLRAIDDLIPEPVQATLAQVRGVVVDQGLPRLGVLLTPQSAAPAPPVDLDDPQVRAAAASVARISGVAYSCGRSLTGSGFVVAPDRVVTNAHVVAGVQNPVVELPGLGAREGTVVSFDPERDLALIAVDTTAKPLPLGAALQPGSAAVVQGYPYGGPLTVVDAQVLSTGSVGVPDIYGRTTVTRDLYALAARVEPGDSGGPLLTATGAVAGIVFARDEKLQDRGYAMTDAELAPVVRQAPSLTRAVSTGACAS